jgi:hypothetical protein
MNPFSLASAFLRRSVMVVAGQAVGPGDDRQPELERRH